LSVDSLLLSFEDNRQILLESPNKDTSFYDDSGNFYWKRTYTLNERQFLLFKAKQLNQIQTKHIQPQTLYLSNKSKKQIQRATIAIDKESLGTGGSSQHQLPEMAANYYLELQTTINHRTKAKQK
jgi:hypothetical protein